MKEVDASKLAYMPRLDGLRGVAIGAVLVEHFLSNRFVNGFAPGGFGVLTFFVLSGYLITSILLRYRDQGVPIRAAAAHFYWRRLLRLSPPYYVAICVALVFGVAGMRSTWWIHALYLSNVKIALQGAWGGAGHFWSLSVEEQFYLFWFFVVVVLPRRFLAPAILASIATASLYRLGLYMFGVDHINFKCVLLPGKMDSLAVGALIAYAGRSAKFAFIERLFLDRRILVFSLFAAALVSWVHEWNDATGCFAYPLAITLAAGCLVRSGAEPRADWRLDWLSWSPVRYLGRISYGVYVYHGFVPDLLKLIVPGLDVSKLPFGGRFLLLSSISIALASASYRFMERPILKLKDAVPLRTPDSHHAAGKESATPLEIQVPAGITEPASAAFEMPETVRREAET